MDSQTESLSRQLAAAHLALESLGRDRQRLLAELSETKAALAGLVAKIASLGDDLLADRERSEAA
jgi:hypothetical protein